MGKYGNLAGIVADLDHYIDIVEKEGLGVAGLCMRMAKMELQIKIHGVSNDEFDALCEFMQTAVANRIGSSECDA